MMLAGALCGSCLVWSYTNAPARPSAPGWLAYNGLHVTLLVALGVTSLVLLEPTASMGELAASTDPLGELLPSALALMAVASVVGSAIVWAVSGRTLRSIPSMATTQVLLVVLVGHNVAVLGLVEVPDEGAALGSFLGITLFLAASFACAYLLLDGVAARIVTCRRTIDTSTRRRQRR